MTKIKAIKSNNPQDWANYERMRNQVNTEIKSAKTLFYTNKFVESKGNPRKTWQAFNELTCRKTDKLSIKEVKVDGVSLFKSSDVSNAFNNHFASVGPKLGSKILSCNGNDTNQARCYL